MAKRRETANDSEKIEIDDIRDRASHYDSALVVSYGQFVELTYQMYQSAPDNPTPKPPSLFPQATSSSPGYK